ncbi:MAG: hypothetical protein QNJ97_09075 [Myxococcota bacterium]|nr:hypothetical protein [Myxococcota bacterium]
MAVVSSIPSNVKNLTTQRANNTNKPRSKDERRLAFYQHQGLFAEDKTGASYTRATTQKELEQAYRLIHDVFTDMKFIFPRKSGMRIRRFESKSLTIIYVAKIKEYIISTLSMIIDSEPLGLPSDMAFKRELDSFRLKNYRLCEISCQATASQYRHTSICTELIRHLFVYAWMYSTGVVISVSPNQKKFYEFMGFKQIGGKRSYSDEVDDPVICMLWDFDQLKREWKYVDVRDGTINAFLKSYFLISNPVFSSTDTWSKNTSNLFNQSSSVPPFINGAINTSNHRDDKVQSSRHQLVHTSNTIDHKPNTRYSASPFWVANVQRRLLRNRTARLMRNRLPQNISKAHGHIHYFSG